MKCGSSMINVKYRSENVKSIENGTKVQEKRNKAASSTIGETNCTSV